jgi:hypothetical protein
MNHFNKDGGSAFPQAEYPHLGQAGMTLRDYFAAKAMASILNAAANAGLAADPENAAPIAKASYFMADAMLAARTEGPTE